MLIVYITWEPRHWVALRVCYLNRVVKDFFSLFEVFCCHDCSSLINPFGLLFFPPFSNAPFSPLSGQDSDEKSKSFDKALAY